MADETPSEQTAKPAKRIARLADLALLSAALCCLFAIAATFLVLFDVSRESAVNSWVSGAVIILLLVTLIVASTAKFVIRKRRNELTGEATARLSQALAIIAFFASAAVLASPSYCEAKLREKVATVRTDMRELAKALEAYRADQGTYPAAAVGAESVNGALSKSPEWGRLPSFRLTRDPDILKTLTTPVAYFVDHSGRNRYPRDLFDPNRDATYAYLVTKTSDAVGWILASPGPDRIFEAELLTAYDPSTAQPPPALLQLTYDPTNGTLSSGDIWRIKG